MSRRAIAFTGPSDSGKTTLIVKLSNKMRSNFRIAIIKHDPSNKANFDKEGKDSWKFSQTGAEVVVTSPQATTLLSNQSRSIEEIIPLFNDFDFLFVEGLKTIPLPRIGIFRNSIDLSYIKYINALAIDESINIKDYDIPKHIDILDLNDTESIIKWIQENALYLKDKNASDI